MIELTARCLDPDGCPFKSGQFCEIENCATEHDEDVCLPRSVSAHEKNLRALACVISKQRPVTLHHCRGGSMATSLFGTPGAGQKQNDALQIPLLAHYHIGPKGIDAKIGRGSETWEKEFGLQVDHLSSISRQLRYNLWALAWRWSSPIVRERVGRFLRESRSRFHPR